MVKKKLYRNEKNKIIGGVCAGIADYYNADPVLIRLIWVTLTLIWGVGLLAYILAWIIVPVKKKK